MFIYPSVFVCAFYPAGQLTHASSNCQQLSIPPGAFLGGVTVPQADTPYFPNPAMVLGGDTLGMGQWLSNAKLGRKKVTWKPQVQIDHTLLLESFEQMYSSVKKLLQKRHRGVLFSTLSNNTAYQGGWGKELIPLKYKHSHGYALCDQVFTKKYIVFNK